MKDYLGNEPQAEDRVVFIWPDCTFQEGRIKYLYEGCSCIGVSFGGKLYTIYSNQCIKVNL